MPSDHFTSTTPAGPAHRPVLITAYVTPIVRPVPMVWTDNGWRAA